MNYLRWFDNYNGSSWTIHGRHQPTVLLPERSGCLWYTFARVPHTENILESEQEARIVQIDIDEAFDKINHQGITYQLCSVGIRGSVLSILTHILSKRSHHVVVDRSLSQLVNVVSGVPQGSVLARYCSSCYSVIVPSVISDPVIGLHSGEYADRLCRWLDFFCCAIQMALELQ